MLRRPKPTQAQCPGPGQVKGSAVLLWFWCSAPGCCFPSGSGGHLLPAVQLGWGGGLLTGGREAVLTQQGGMQLGHRGCPRQNPQASSSSASHCGHPSLWRRPGRPHPAAAWGRGGEALASQRGGGGGHCSLLVCHTWVSLSCLPPLSPTPRMMGCQASQGASGSVFQGCSSSPRAWGGGGEPSAV